MIPSIVAGVLASALVAVVAWLVRNRMWLRVLFPAVLIRPRQELRISIASVMRLRCEGRHLLFRTPLRPEALAPPGGVVKYFSEAVAALDELEFRPEVPHSVPPGKGERDLRGYVRVSALPKFLRWYSSGEGRESHTDALRRELHEEFEEVGLQRLENLAGLLEFRHVRRVREGPARVGSQGPFQLRVIEVYEPVSIADGPVAELCTRLRTASRAGRDVVLATDEEIRRGRSEAGLIAHHSAYLLGSKALRADLPPI